MTHYYTLLHITHMTHDTQFDCVVRCASCGRHLDERPVEREHPCDVRARVVVELVAAQVEVRQARARAERL